MNRTAHRVAPQAGRGIHFRWIAKSVATGQYLVAFGLRDSTTFWGEKADAVRSSITGRSMIGDLRHLGALEWEQVPI